MRPAVRCFFALLVVTVAVTAVDAQAVPQNVSVSAGPVLDAAGPKQRVAIKSVYLKLRERQHRGHGIPTQQRAHRH